MYNYIAIALCILFVITSLMTTKNCIKSVANPLFLFGILWTIILGLDSLHLYSIKITDQKIYLIISVGIISFLIGYIIIYNFRKKYRIVLNSNNKLLDNNLYKDYIPRYKLLCFMGCICILYYLKNFFIVMDVLLQGNDLSVIRLMAQDEGSILNARSSIENALRILVILPFSIALEPIVAVDYWNGKRHKPLLIICITIIVLRVITDGGRTPIVNFMIYLIIGYIVSIFKVKKGKEKQKNSKNKKWYLVIGIVAGSLILYKTTLARDGENALRTVYYYFAMEPYMFNIWAESVEYKELIGYGLTSLNGFIFPVLYLIKNFFGVDFPKYWLEIYDMILLTDSQWKVITQTGIRANAYVSMFWYFYTDARIIGVIIGMLLYGMLTCSSYISAMKYNTCKSVCVHAFILQGLFFSFIRFPFANMYYSLAFLIIIFIAYKPIKIIKKDNLLERIK